MSKDHYNQSPGANQAPKPTQVKVDLNRLRALLDQGLSKDEAIRRIAAEQEQDQPAAPDTLAAALAYAERGWFVFPCGENKHPIETGGYHPDGTPKRLAWSKAATTEPEKIRQLWGRWPGANIGLAAKKSGLVIVDLDIKHDLDGIAAWAALGISDAGALHQRTPSGGLHLIFCDSTGGKVGNSPGPIKGKGIDIRGGGDRNGGYILLAPSRTPAGVYVALGDWNQEPGPLPAALAMLLQKPEQAPAAPERFYGNTRTDDAGAHWLEKALSQAAEGNRNETGFWLAGQLRDAGLSRGEAEPVMLDYARRVPGDGYTEGEALASLESAYRAPAREPARRVGFSGNGDHAGELESPIWEFSTNPGEIPPEPEQPPDDLPLSGEPPSYLLTEEPDHGGHADCVLAMFPDRIGFSEAWGWIFYNGRYWQRENAEMYVGRAVEETLKARRMAAVKAEREALVKATRGTAGNVAGTKDRLKDRVTVGVDEFDRDPDLLNCNNGVLSLRTGDLQPHSSGQKFTYCLPVDYNPAADASQWIDFLRSAIGDDPELRRYLQMAIGYSLTGHTWEEVLFYVYGPTRSGKGTFTETLLAMLGQPLATEADFQTFTADRYGDTQNFDLAPLKPCRFVAASESNKGSPLNPAKIKALTGGNYVRCAYKHRDHFSYRPQFKIWLSSNHPANVDVDDDAAWARVRVIEFPNSHLGSEDKTLKAKLRRPENLEGLLAWAADGARTWYQAGSGLQTPDRVAQSTQSQRAVQDFTSQFLDEMTESDPGAWVHSGALWDAYKSWCEANGVPHKFQNAFSQAVATKGYKLTRMRVDGRPVRVISGLKLATRDTP